MAVEVKFYLNDNDVDRLWALKEETGKTQISSNEFAKELLEQTLHRMHPEKVKYDEETGELIPRKRNKRGDNANELQ